MQKTSRETILKNQLGLLRSLLTVVVHQQPQLHCGWDDNVPDTAVTREPRQRSRLGAEGMVLAGCHWQSFLANGWHMAYLDRFDSTRTNLLERVRTRLNDVVPSSSSSPFSSFFDWLLWFSLGKCPFARVLRTVNASQLNDTIMVHRNCPETLGGPSLNGSNWEIGAA